MTPKKFSGETKAKQEGGIMKNKTKAKQTGRGALWKTKCPPCSWMKNMFHKVTSTYTANFWQVIPWGAGVVAGGFLLHLSIWILVKSPVIYINILHKILTPSWNGL
jgi:hypothetical protein